MDTAEAVELETELLTMATSGVGNIAKMQRVCSKIVNACSDVPVHIRELAQLPNNSHRERDLHRWVARQPWRDILPDLYEFKTPITMDGIHETEGLQTSLCPHEVFAQIHTYPELFHYLFGTPEELTQFWDGCRHSSWYEMHPVDEVHTCPEVSVPYGLYGDDAGVFTHQKVLCLFLGLSG